tara:strand:+ start:947 stop:1246 length:300 start_codon:yes stop_codon:yes gene_type:complete
MKDKKENKFWTWNNIAQGIGIIIVVRLAGFTGAFALIAGGFIYKRTKLKYGNIESLCIGSSVGIILYLVVMYYFFRNTDSSFAPSNFLVYIYSTFLNNL